jgi:hypothetical protein
MQLMQLLIVILLICGACAYLVFKWLPKQLKQNLYAWIIKKVPPLNSILNMPNNACSEGCSSCGACEQPTLKNNATNQSKFIQIYPNSSTLN